jgi:hypothetical protein
VSELRKSDPRGAGGELPADGQARSSLKVFVSYRHEDIQGTAWALYLKLEQRFGAESIFFDYGSLRPGMRWFDEIRSHLAHSGAVIALIGPQWMSILNAHQQRGGEDYVLRELDLALRGGPQVTLIPLLVDNAELPDPRDLPPALKALPGCQAEHLRHANLLDDIDRLIERLDAIHRTADQDDERPDLPSASLSPRP